MDIINKLKNVKREYLILGGIIIVLLLLLIFNRPGRRNYSLPELKSLKTNEITKLIITKQSNSIFFLKEDNNWYIVPQKYIADNLQIDELIKTTVGLKIDDLVSESTNYLLYDLDNINKINVKALKGEKVVRDFDIGKVSQTRSHTFIKLDKRFEVYHANGNFRNNFDKQMPAFRDKKIFQIIKEDINEITLINRVKAEFSLKKEVITPEININTNDKEKQQDVAPPTQKIVWKTGKNKEAKESAVNDILNTLSNLTCDSFVEGKTAEDFKKPIYTIKLKGTKEYSINIYKINKDSNKYPSTVAERNFPFFLRQNIAEKLMKKYTEF